MTIANRKIEVLRYVLKTIIQDNEMGVLVGGAAVALARGYHQLPLVEQFDDIDILPFAGISPMRFQNTFANNLPRENIVTAHNGFRVTDVKINILADATTNCQSALARVNSFDLSCCRLMIAKRKFQRWPASTVQYKLRNYYDLTTPELSVIHSFAVEPDYLAQINDNRDPGLTLGRVLRYVSRGVQVRKGALEDLQKILGLSETIRYFGGSEGSCTDENEAAATITPAKAVYGGRWENLDDVPF